MKLTKEDQKRLEWLDRNMPHFKDARIQAERVQAEEEANRKLMGKWIKKVAA